MQSLRTKNTHIHTHKQLFFYLASKIIWNALLCPSPSVFFSFQLPETKANTAHLQLTDARSWYCFPLFYGSAPLPRLVFTHSSIHPYIHVSSNHLPLHTTTTTARTLRTTHWVTKMSRKSPVRAKQKVCRVFNSRGETYYTYYNGCISLSFWANFL